jgi:hypothetical protein
MRQKLVIRSGAFIHISILSKRGKAPQTRRQLRRRVILNFGFCRSLVSANGPSMTVHFLNDSFSVLRFAANR